MFTRSGRTRASIIDVSPGRTPKGVSPPRSPSRIRKSSPTASKSSSPARPARKSPSRKSPNRKTPSKFPARKSPSRTTLKEIRQTAEVNPQIVQKSPSKRPSIKSDVSVRLEKLSSKLEISRNTRSKRIEYSLRDVTTVQDVFMVDKVNGLETISNDIPNLRYRRSIEEPAPRRSSRLREFIDNLDNHSDSKRSASKTLSESKSASKSLGKFSDDEHSEESVEERKSKSVTRKLATPIPSSVNSLTNLSSKWEFGGRLGSLTLILLMPLILFAILISCKKSCSFNIDVSTWKDLKQWFTLQSFGFILAQYLLQAILALIPIFGIKSDRMDDTGKHYCFNALFSSTVTVGTLFLLTYLKVVNKDIILNQYLQLAAVSYIFAVILSIIMYIKSRKKRDDEKNSYGNTGYVLYDFFMGREIHPYIQNLDIKVWITRISNITTLILLLLIFSQGLHLRIDKNEIITLENYREILSKVQLKHTLLLFSTMQIIYIMYFIIGEHKITSTFFWQSEGVGYLQIVSSALYPFYFTTISKHVADSAAILSTNTLVYASLIFCFGFLIMLISNNIKHKFRTNPLQPGLANLNCMPTFHGKKLLVANLWGVLRHPNYAGDIIIHIAFALPGIMSRQYVAASPALLTIVMLVHRAWRDHGRCRRRYGAAWQRYCKRVPSVFIPKVF